MIFARFLFRRAFYLNWSLWTYRQHRTLSHRTIRLSNRLDYDFGVDYCHRSAVDWYFCRFCPVWHKILAWQRFLCPPGAWLILWAWWSGSCFMVRFRSDGRIASLCMWAWYCMWLFRWCAPPLPMNTCCLSHERCRRWACGTVVSRAMIRDRLHPKQMAKAFSLMVLVMGIVLTAPFGVVVVKSRQLAGDFGFGRVWHFKYRADPAVLHETWPMSFATTVRWMTCQPIPGFA